MALLSDSLISHFIFIHEKIKNLIFELYLKCYEVIVNQIKKPLKDNKQRVLKLRLENIVNLSNACFYFLFLLLLLTLLTKD